MYRFLKDRFNYWKYKRDYKDQEFLYALAHYRGYRCVSAHWDGFSWVGTFDKRYPPQPKTWLEFDDWRMRIEPI